MQMMMLMMAMAMPAATPLSLSVFLLKRHDVDKRMPPPLNSPGLPDLGQCYRGLDPSPFHLPITPIYSRPQGTESPRGNFSLASS